MPAARRRGLSTETVSEFLQVGAANGVPVRTRPPFMLSSFFESPSEPRPDGTFLPPTKDKPPHGPKYIAVAAAPPEAFSSQMHIDTVVGGYGRSSMRAPMAHAREEAMLMSFLGGATLFVILGGLFGEHCCAKLYRKAKGLPPSTPPDEPLARASGGSRSAGRPISG
eukprot:TRINITY_DN75418_c0_g1_i1.p1 TRINITY_DN75418_c0_g1~~TRINITY_DN75418_c0_g1_i1.p1  ORF type:complete len:178 (+),score=25.49 TRINITY_DN75418_c0_g1_i1:34-534(+)